MVTKFGDTEWGPSVWLDYFPGLGYYDTQFNIWCDYDISYDYSNDERDLDSTEEYENLIPESWTIP